MSKDTGKKIATSAIVAGIIGYAVGLLTAPKSGKETRKDIKNAATKAKTEAEKKLKAVLSDLNKVLAEAKAKGTDLKGKAKTEYEKAMAKAVDSKEKVRQILSSLHDGDVDDPELKKALSDAKAALKHLEKFVKS